MISLLVAVAFQRAVRTIAPLVLESHLPYGTVRVYLPGDLRPGEHVSGSVFASPEGDDWNSQHRNLEFLDSLVLDIGSTSCKVGDAVFEGDLPVGRNLLASLRDDAGRVYGNMSADVERGAGDGLDTVIVQAGTPIGVVGDFDGVRPHTQVQIDGLTAGVLAEGRDECFVTAPTDRQGLIQLRIRNGDRLVTTRVNVVTLSFLTPGTPTVTGKKSSIGVEVSGLQGLTSDKYPVDVNLTIGNPKIARFVGPDPGVYRLEINPQDVINGSVLKSVPILALTGGAYLVKAFIEAKGLLQGQAHEAFNK